jgi:hypothetical protein
VQQVDTGSARRRACGFCRLLTAALYRRCAAVLPRMPRPSHSLICCVKPIFGNLLHCSIVVYVVRVANRVSVGLTAMPGSLSLTHSHRLTTRSTHSLVDFFEPLKSFIVFLRLGDEYEEQLKVSCARRSSFGAQFVVACSGFFFCDRRS